MASRILKWMVLLALGLFVIAVVIFLFGGSSFSESQITLELEGPTQASVGDEVTYKVKYSNGTKLDLHDLSFKFTYPEESIVIKDGEIAEELSETFTIEELKVGKSEEKEFKAFIVGDKGNIKNAKVDLEFKAGSLRSSFEKSDTISTTLVSVPVSLTLVAPPTVIPGQSVNYLLDYRNESDNNISDIKFEFDYPDEFVISEQIPKPKGANNWPISLLKRGEGGRISIKGILDGKEGEVKTVSISLKRNINGKFVEYQKASTSSLLSNPLLGLDVLVNGAKNYSAHLGDSLQYAIKYKNNSDDNLTGINLEVKLEGEMYDIGKLDTNGGFYDSSSGTIIWNAAVVPDFAALPPGKSGEVKFTASIRDSLPSNIGNRNFSVKASAKLGTPNVPSGIDDSEISATADVVTRISAKPVFLQSALYNDPVFGSSGPLPLQAGKETTFTVHWQITNPGNDMNQAEISALLPSGVTWKNVVSVGLDQPEPAFNKDNSEVKWIIGLLPQGVGVLIPKYEVSFQVSVKPTAAGEAPLILKDSKFSGTDSFTKEKIILNVSDMTTDGLND